MATTENLPVIAENPKMEELNGMSKTVIIAVIVIIILTIAFWMSKEYLNDPFYLDQIAMESHNPMIIKYMGRVRDWRGMSPKDYYVENDMNSKNYAAPQYLSGDIIFTNQANLGPKPLGHYLKTVRVS